MWNFDGKGINDKSNKYAPRIATLTEHGHNINAGPTLAAAHDIAKALKALHKEFISRMALVEACDWTEEENAADELTQAALERLQS